jgi:hypothetical protein
MLKHIVKGIEQNGDLSRGVRLFYLETDNPSAGLLRDSKITKHACFVVKVVLVFSRAAHEFITRRRRTEFVTASIVAEGKIGEAVRRRYLMSVVLKSQEESRTSSSSSRSSALLQQR